MGFKNVFCDRFDTMTPCQENATAVEDATKVNKITQKCSVDLAFCHF